MGPLLGYETNASRSAALRLTASAAAATISGCNRSSGWSSAASTEAVAPALPARSTRT